MQNGLHCVWELLDQIPHFFDLLRIGFLYILKLIQLINHCLMRTTTRSIIFVTLLTGKGIRPPVFIFKTILPSLLKPLFSYPEQSAWGREGESRRELWASRSLALSQSRTQRPWRRWRRTPERFKDDEGQNKNTFSREQQKHFLYCNHPLQILVHT